MSISATFIKRPVATILLTCAVLLAGVIAFRLLPVSPLPQVDFPTISVNASLPGADPVTMSTSVAAPLERQFGRIAGVTEMTSTSNRGSTSITLQFELNRDINGAARDVQGAINAARGFLPANLPSNPSYRKVNPSDAPIMIIALTSATMTKPQLYDAASTILNQKLSQVEGVGQVFVGGSSLPAVRVDLNPLALNRYGISLESVRGAISATNVNRPKGNLVSGDRSWEVRSNDQLRKAAEYLPLVVSYRNGAAVRLKDIANVQDSVEDIRTTGIVNSKPAVMVILFRQPGANIIETVDKVRALLPQLKAALPGAVDLSVVLDRTPPIRGSLRDVEISLMLSGMLVILVVFWFLRNVRATVIPALAVAVSIIGTFAVMYLCGYSLDNLSLMALTIATGFVVDDAIVVLENITRYREAGLSPMEAAFKGSREISFTVVSMSISLIAVFIPILLMEGMVGRLFREFAVTLSAAILVSLVVSLTLTPMLSAHFLRPEAPRVHGWLFRASEGSFNWLHGHYETSLRWALRHSRLMLAVLLVTVVVNVLLFRMVPKGFFPEQDTGRISGNIQAAQDTSYQAMSEKLARVVAIIKEDPEVDFVTGFTGGGGGGGSTTNTARMFISLKPFKERKASAQEIIKRLRGKLSTVPGAPTFLQPVQDLRVGGRASSALYQYTLKGTNLSELNDASQRLLRKLRSVPQLADLNSDLQDRGREARLVIDRSTAARLGISPAAIDNALYDAFGQRQVAISYTLLNQYHVVMEVDPAFWQSPETLKDIYVPGKNGALVPLATFTRFEPSASALAVNHQGQFPAITLSFNLVPGVALGEGVRLIEAAAREIGLPAGIQGSFAGTAQAFQASLANEPFLILAALITVYIVLGVLYESYMHPLTILSTLPSAGVGAALALLLFRTDLSLIAIIGVILLIGIVKKNGIMMVDFALMAQRSEGKAPEAAIFESCLLRFRPIMMTTMAALFGALPLALGSGVGSELRRPLGISIVGGLIFSQMMTLYTTPVVYLYMDRLRQWLDRKRGKSEQRRLYEQSRNDLGA
jgi:hydrophobe/amphiphile efflux-1 (HAE1) family protein